MTIVHVDIHNPVVKGSNYHRADLLTIRLGDPDSSNGELTIYVKGIDEFVKLIDDLMESVDHAVLGSPVSRVEQPDDIPVAYSLTAH